MMSVAEDRALATATPSLFAHTASNGRWIPKPHLCPIDDLYLEAATVGGVHAIVTMPPRHGKSELGSAWAPPWLLGVRPDFRVMLGAYQANFAAMWGQRARDRMLEFGPSYFGVEVDPDHSARDDWGIKGHLGGMITAGVGGAFTGRGADLVLIDDPIKNQEEALSEVYREKTWEWFNSTVYTRLEPGGSVIVTLTRWHEDDLAGRLIADQPDKWRVIRLPARAEKDDPIGREEDEALWPERYDLEALKVIERQIGSFWFSALYQARPTPAEGGLLKRDWWQYAAPPSDVTGWMTCWDMAFKDTKDSSYVVGQLWCRRGADSWLVDQVRARMDFPSTTKAMLRFAAKHPQAHTHLVEDKANGPAVIDTLRSVLGGIVPAKAKESKEARVSSVSMFVEAGNVHLPTTPNFPSGGTVEAFVDECAAFPNGAHDDQVDACAHALRRIYLNTAKVVGSPLA